MAFPTTPVLDDFSVDLSNWTTPVFGDGTLTLTGGRLSFSAAGYGSGVWTTSFGPDMEAYCDIVTRGVDVNIFARVTNITSSNTGYILNWQGGIGTYTLDRNLAGASITVFSGTQTFIDGDALGMSVVGSLISIYRKPFGGAWGLVNSGTNSDVSGVGQIGCAIHGTSQLLDNFGGGTAVPSTTLSDDPPMTFLGRGAGW